ncbi:MAG: hypothetical protein HY735_06440 [Verrucomicrobia bacterium]|nr:hypothetical protein [Verrucomicrobiota bacterium]
MRPLWCITVSLLIQNSEPVRAFWLQEVDVLPANFVRAGEETRLRITIATPSTPAKLYKPTEVIFSKEFNKFLIKVYPTGGTERRIGLLGETVSLGKLTFGEYVYEVQIYPLEVVGSSGDYRIRFGNFSVVPELKNNRQGTNLVLRWSAEATRYYLEWSTNLVDPKSWRAVPNVGALNGLERVHTNSIASGVLYFRLRQDPIRPF